MADSAMSGTWLDVPRLVGRNGGRVLDRCEPRRNVADYGHSVAFGANASPVCTGTTQNTMPDGSRITV